MANLSASEEITFHQSKTFMDYLHGDVERGDADLACAYEYARESKGLWEAAKKRDELLREHPTWTCEKVVLAILSRNAMRGRAHPPWEWRFLMCRSFPTKDWKELTTSERKEILKRYETRPVPPLPMLDLLWTPQAGALLDKFKEMADANTPTIPEVPPGKEIPPMPDVPAMAQKGGSVYWCLFEVDFSESKNRLSDRFIEWFKQHCIEQLWRQYKRQRTRKTAKPLHARKVRR